MSYACEEASASAAHIQLEFIFFPPMHCRKALLAGLCHFYFMWPRGASWSKDAQPWMHSWALCPGLCSWLCYFFQDQFLQATIGWASPQGCSRLEFQELHLMCADPSGAIPPTVTWIFYNKFNFDLSRITRDNHFSAWPMKFKRLWYGWCMGPGSILSFGYCLCKTLYVFHVFAWVSFRFSIFFLHKTCFWRLNYLYE